jgi:hypothetical protein
MRAYADGVIKPSDLSARDIGKRRKVHWLLQEMRRREQKELRLLIWVRDAIRNLIGTKSETLATARAEQEAKSFQSLAQLILDEKFSFGDLRERMKDQMRASWEQQFGDLSDPKTAAEIDKVAAGLRRMRELNNVRSRPAR